MGRLKKFAKTNGWRCHVGHVFSADGRIVVGSSSISNVAEAEKFCPTGHKHRSQLVLALHNFFVCYRHVADLHTASHNRQFQVDGRSALRSHARHASSRGESLEQSWQWSSVLDDTASHTPSFHDRCKSLLGQTKPPTSRTCPATPAVHQEPNASAAICHPIVCARGHHASQWPTTSIQAIQHFESDFGSKEGSERACENSKVLQR